MPPEATVFASSYFRASGTSFTDYRSPWPSNAIGPPGKSSGSPKPHPHRSSNITRRWTR